MRRALTSTSLQRLTLKQPYRCFTNTNISLRPQDVEETTKPPSNHHTKFMNPIVRELWEQRQATKERLMSLTDEDSQTTGSGNLTELTAKMMKKGTKAQFVPKFRHPSESKTIIDYNFESDEFLREAYQSPGGTMRFGKVLEDLDALAGNIAFHHVVGGEDVMLVTAAVDRIALRDIPQLDKDQRLSGQVTFVGSSSMEIRLQIQELKDNDGADDDEYVEHWLEGFFTFVAVDPVTNKPVKICPLVPETSEERALFELGALKTAKKKEARKRSKSSVGTPISAEAVQMEQRAQQLLEDAFPLLRMPSLADSNAILMSHTQMQNTLIAQPQVRNLSNKIFGGFLMRRAFELAFSNAYSFGGEWPQMLEVDNITFNAPVNVGDLLSFNSRVIYSLPDGGDLDDITHHSSKPLVMIEVECYVMEPEIAKAHLSNRFYFTFVLPTKETCRKVLPGTLEEARRMVQRMVADEEQAGLGKGYLGQYGLESDGK